MNTRIAAGALVVLALAVGGFTYVYFKNQTVPAGSSARSGISTPSNSQPGQAGPELTPGRPIYIYTVTANGGDDNNLAPVKIDVANRATPAKGVLEALIQSPESPLPSGTRLLGIRIS